MTSLWGDGWFYISALGFLVSCALFLYLLGQYRSAMEEVEEADGTPSPPLPVAKPLAAAVAPAPVVTSVVEQPPAKNEKTLVLPARTAPPQPMTSNAPPEGRPGGAASAALPAPAAAPAASGPGYTGPERRRSDFTSSGGISPAVVYLQNIKSQMEKFDKEITALKVIASQQAAQGELLLRRLGELADSVKTGDARRPPPPAPTRSVELSLDSGIVKESPAPVQAVELQPAEKPAVQDVAPAPAPAVLEPAPPPPPQPAAESPAADKTVVLSPTGPEPKVETPAAAPSPAPVSTATLIEALPQTPDQPAVPSQPRKGPVWPV